MAEYIRVANKPLEKAIASEFSGYIEKALLTIRKLQVYLIYFKFTLLTVRKIQTKPKLCLFFI